MCNYLEIINFFYSENDPAREILLLHSTQVRNKALEISRRIGGDVDIELVSNGAMLHDIGIRFCDAPDIGCFGEDKYILHGILGAESLRCLKFPGVEKLARICERHTGSGISASEIRLNSLPLPERDFLPESLEEKIVCLADKFFSRSGDLREKPLSEIRREMSKFGAATLERFDALYSELMM
jgi:uncharacterized protein